MFGRCVLHFLQLRLQAIQHQRAAAAAARAAKARQRRRRQNLALLHEKRKSHRVRQFPKSDVANAVTTFSICF